jgi:membrane protein implicated in regulation of membrane protease activity
MELLRAFLSIACFCLGIYFCIDFFLSNYDWTPLVFAVMAFLLAYFIWPSRRRGKREEEHAWLDFIEIVIELPVEIGLWMFRLFTRLFKDGDASIDL